MLPVKQFTKKLLITSAFMGALLPTSSFAATIQDRSVMCISDRYLNKYERHLSRGELDFAKEMRDRAQCIVNRRPHAVAVLAEQRDKSKVQLKNGHRVWVRNTALIEPAERSTETP